ncbi:hypothetical protein CHARACLAT_032898 [Characodon lateralis]|uniref:Uncharacterized protein n=1 Tax=Characodon lateralis TaxID=208331 RepID=A0ABU7DLT5_9TELE|nr:hypothetical protein [Characodon lateralis]
MEMLISLSAEDHKMHEKHLRDTFILTEIPKMDKMETITHVHKCGSRQGSTGASALTELVLARCTEDIEPNQFPMMICTGTETITDWSLGPMKFCTFTVLVE